MKERKKERIYRRRVHPKIKKKEERKKTYIKRKKIRKKI